MASKQKDICRTCKRDLAGRRTIVSAAGRLYCTRGCCAQDLGYTFMRDMSETINPVDIGIVKK